MRVGSVVVSTECHAAAGERLIVAELTRAGIVTDHD
jgi:hypothetical protein